MDKELCLGTAQFGLDYGITNKSGKVEEKEVKLIINKAIEENIRFAPFDIAYKFSYEVPLAGKNFDKEDKLQIFDSNYHFGRHGKRFLNSDELLNLKNQK